MPGFTGTVIKDVTQVASAVGTEDLRADHPEAPVLDVFYAAFYSVIKAWPAAAALEFLVTLEQFGITGRTAVFAIFEVQVILSGMGSFCSFFAKDAVLFVR